MSEHLESQQVQLALVPANADDLPSSTVALDQFKVRIICLISKMDVLKDENLTDLGFLGI